MKQNKQIEEKLLQIRHSTAHLLAHAITQLYPKTLLTIGPATKDGFFYDFQPEVNFKESDLPLIEQRMRELAKQDISITHEEISKAQAKKLYKNNPFKLELIDGIKEETVGISRQGEFFDLCKGGHVASTGEIKHFFLTHISGSYWRADQKNAPLQRISGNAFLTEKDLKNYLSQKELAAKYDHRKLGKEMSLFSFHEEGTGFPFYHPKGTFVVNKLKDFVRNIWQTYNYQEIITPIAMDVKLWKQSGHYDHYRKHMYFCNVDDIEYAVRPMNCPGSILIYKENLHSYKELPLRLAEFGHVHRYELSGVLHGLFRVRAFTIDDTHMYCTPEHIEPQIVTSVGIIDNLLKTFGFESIHYAVSTKPDNAIGSDDLWEKATSALKNGLAKAGKEFEIYEGEGAFYGPKIGVTVLDSMGRSWQASTVQVDFFMPQNFELFYIDNKGEKQTPIIVHQALLGSLERFFGMLLEHCKGHLPFWLCPAQIKVLPITSDQLSYAQSITEKLKTSNLRVVLDESAEPLSAKIKSAQIERIPWMLVLGQKEQESNSITLRHASGKQEFNLAIHDILEKAQQENKVV